MAATSASFVQKSFKYDVFLSFRGEDVRKTFVDHLYHALVSKGIITYKDDERIEKGGRISDQLIKAIEESQIHIIIFSKNYASSSWCLHELVKIMECQKGKGQTAYPVFYDVEPTEVRKQSGAVGEAFAKHVKRGSWSSVLSVYNIFLYCTIFLLQWVFFFVDWFKWVANQEDDVRKWRNALKEAAGLAGMELKKTNEPGCWHEAEFIKKIIEDISPKLHFVNSNVDEKLVGMRIRVENVVSSLKIESDDVRMIGIKGIGGGGKTTLARAVFNYISTSFEGKSFVENVREFSKGSQSGLKDLQKKILSDVLNDHKFVKQNIQELENMMKKMMRSVKVLLVLDDVDEIEQLETLAGELNWFKQGSRIIITTRDEHVLKAHKVNLIHDISLLSNEEAICLFNRHAFGTEIPKQGCEELSRKVVCYAAGLPLTVKVLGSLLCDKTEVEWDDAIKRLKTIPEDQSLKRLELSYNGLENDQKEIFLEVACILKGQQKDYAIRILESCGFNAKIGLRVLEQKSLLTISYDGYLRMHDLIEEMGRNIVRRLHPDEPNKHSRLWIKDEIEDILVNETGTEAIRSIHLWRTRLHPFVIMKGLRKMKRLRSLYVASFRIEWEFDELSCYLPEALQSLQWCRYPFRFLPRTFQADKLVNLELVDGNISQLWEGEDRKHLNKLRFLDLIYSKVRNLSLGTAPHLESLKVKGCKELVELHLPVECPNLIDIDLSGSKVSIVNIGMTPRLESLNVKGCNKLVELHLPVECPNLIDINLSGSKVSTLNIGMTSRLESLNVEGCNKLVELHLPIKCPNLIDIDLRDSKVSTLSLGMTPRLKSLIVKGCNKLVDLHLPIECPNLLHINLSGLCASTNLESFSASICGLQNLKILILEGSIPKLPKDLGQLESLVNVTLSIKSIKNLPDSICKLKHLEYLKLNSCWLLEQLPKELGRLECLKELDLTDCTSLRGIPDSICNMKSLTRLHLPYCILVEKLPEEVGGLECLEELNLAGSGISSLPLSIYESKGLRIIGSKWRLESYGFTSLTEMSLVRSFCVV